MSAWMKEALSSCANNCDGTLYEIWLGFLVLVLITVKEYKTLRVKYGSTLISNFMVGGKVPSSAPPPPRKKGAVSGS